MSKKQSAKPAATQKASRVRNKRSAGTRKCLTRAHKTLFAGAPKSILKAMAP